MAKKYYGQCCICGRESELTFEHIPPRAAFNQFALKQYDFWNYLLHSNTRYIPSQRGAGKYSLCASCNNLTGEWYGSVVNYLYEEIKITKEEHLKIQEL